MKKLTSEQLKKAQEDFAKVIQKGRETDTRLIIACEFNDETNQVDVVGVDPSKLPFSPEGNVKP